MAKDAIALLEEDHKKVKALLEQLAGSGEDEADKRTKLLEQIDTELKIHTSIEETIFYPAFREAVKSRDEREMYFEAMEEHHVVKFVLPEIKDTDPSSEPFAAKAKVLKELVTHHADEEEEEMFPAAKKVLDKSELEELGARMQARKDEMKASGVPPTDEEKRHDRGR
jgi:hemerythrin-like domain-containing protein